VETPPNFHRCFDSIKGLPSRSMTGAQCTLPLSSVTMTGALSAWK
jgi:hypothetical protein